MPTFVHTYERDTDDHSCKGGVLRRISTKGSPKLVLVLHKMWRLVDTRIVSLADISGIDTEDDNGYISEKEWPFVERLLLTKYVKA